MDSDFDLFDFAASQMEKVAKTVRERHKLL